MSNDIEKIHGCYEESCERDSSSGLDCVKLKVMIPASSDYFDGHFPAFKLLPAVAQIDLLAHFADKYFGTGLAISEVRRFKFSEKILPNTEVFFKITFDKEKSKLSFEILDLEEKTVFASGNCESLNKL